MILKPAMSAYKGIKNPFHFLPALSLSLLAFNSAVAADFSKAKHTYVPPSKIDRRVDFSSMRESISVPARKTASIGKNMKLVPVYPGSKTAHSSARNSSGDNLAKMKQAAKSLEKNGHLDEAQQTLTKITQISPNDRAAAESLATVSLLRAKRYMAANDIPNALTATRQAIAANPGNPAGHKLLNQLYEKVGVDPANVDSRLKTANTLYKQGQYLDAEVEYRASLNVTPTADAHIGLGKIAERYKGPLAAKEHYQQALYIDPNSAAAHREMGIWHNNIGDLAAANSALSQALILNQQDQEASRILVKLWQNQVTKMPNANSHLGLARAYQLSGDLPSAQAEYRQVVQIDPNHPYLPAARQSFKTALARQEADKHIQAAHGLESQGMLQDAFFRANTAVSLYPGNINNRLYQGELLEKLGQPIQARQVYAAILKEDPVNAAAAGRLQALPESALIGTPQPAGFPGTKFGNLLPFNTADTAASIAANTYPVGPPVDHVSSLSNFMGSVRNQMLTSKAQWQQTEGAAHQTLRNIGSPPAQMNGIAQNLQSPAPVPDDDYIARILASPVGSPLPGPATNSTTAALSALSGAPVPSMSGASPNMLSSLSSQVTPSALGPLATVATPEVINSLVSAAVPSLQQVSSAIPAAGMLTQAAPTFSAPQFQAPQFQAPQFQAPQPELMPPITSLAPAVAPSFTPITGSSQGFPSPPAPAPAFNSAPVFNSVPALSSAPVLNSAPTPELALLRPALPGSSISSFLAAPPAFGTASALRFELTKITPTVSNVQLAVILKNDSDKAINLPPNLKALIKYTNRPEAEVKVSFEGRSIPAHGGLSGIVKVPFDKADPNADLVLRNLPLSPSSDPDLHLITTSLIR